ncbi:MAG: hypothetical protein IPL12_18205 [Bacteroidetes bacterium]|nr:hypothetical protein [Bacteroidota bacterium]MBK8345039.1 hypothetical protein [Bacteroidota bacterium]
MTLYFRCLSVIVIVSCVQIVFGTSCILPSDSVRNNSVGSWRISEYTADSGWIFQPLQYQGKEMNTIFRDFGFRIDILNDSVISFDYIKPGSGCGINFEIFEAEYTMNADTMYLSDKNYWIPDTFFIGDFICKMISDTLLYMKKIRNKPSAYSLLLNDILYTDITQFDENAQKAILNFDTMSINWLVYEDSLMEGYWGDYKLIQIGLSEDKQTSVLYITNDYKIELTEMYELPEFKSCPTIILNKPLQVFTSGYNRILACKLKDCDSVKDKFIYLKLW